MLETSIVKEEFSRERSTERGLKTILNLFIRNLFAKKVKEKEDEEIFLIDVTIKELLNTIITSYNFLQTK